MANTAYQSAYTGTQIDTAIGDVNGNTINGSSLTTSASYWFGTSDTAAATVQKEVSIPSIKVLNAGQIIVVKPTVTSTVANSTLKLNSFDAYPMRYNNAAITTSTDSIVWNLNYPSIWLFDGNYWVFLAHGIDSNTTYSTMSVSEGTTGTATSARTMRADYLKQIIETLAPQSDWEEDDSTDPAYIKNKPTIPSKTSDLTNDSGFITGYTETDPVFSASAAAGITSSDITNWNGKTSNIGTITSVKMNGTTVSSSGEADLGTVITSHQDISGKADKSATVSTVTYNTTNKKITKTINGTTTDVVTAATIVTDGGGITSETDPTVPSWAKASSKPSYTASEVGAVPTARTVNGKALSADITLSASDVSALPASTSIPSKTSDLTNDSGYITSADISGVYKYKGSKTNYSNLPTTGNVTGDVWNVVNAYSTYPAGTNFAWDGTTWDALGGSVDLSGYVPTSRTVNGKALSSNISLSASDVSALPSSTYIPTKTSDLTNDSDFITSEDIPEGAAPSTTTPKMDGTAAVGTETKFARGDHRHPTDTSRQAAITSSSKLSADLIEDGTTNKTVTSTEKSTWNSKGTYSKPSGGIPATDLASAVQTSLGKADTALQSYTESDPVFTASAAHGISSSDISNWNAKGTYSKPSGGIPKTDLASAVQTSLGKADTALQSYTESDPVFAASAAHGITSSDISNWNSKTSNIGTITGINMNGASKGTSGVVDLGTVITAHQDISGKADKATSLAGYGITDAYTKTESNTGFYAIYGGIDLNLSETNTINLNSLIAAGSYYNGYSTRSQYCTNRPTENASAFRVYIIGSLGIGSVYIRQRYQEYDKFSTYERYTADGGTTWSAWRLVQANLANYAESSTTLNGYGITDAYTKTEVDDIVDDYLPLSGGTMTNSLVFVNNKGVVGTLSNGNTGGLMTLTNANDLVIAYGLRENSNFRNTNIYAVNNVNLLIGNSNKFKVTSTGVEVTGNESISGTIDVTGAATLSSTLDVTGAITASDAIYLNNAKYINGKNSNDSNINLLGINASNQILIGYGNTAALTNIYGKALGFYYGTRTQGMVLSSSGNLGVGVATPSSKLHVDGNAIITGTLTLGGNPVAVVYSGSTAPSSSTGSDGDIYIQTS